MSYGKHVLTALLLTGVMCVTAPVQPVQAYAADKMIEGAKMCTQYLPKQEREYGIPVHLLAAIASTESGRWHKGLKMPLPWPWTINAEGRGQFFETKQEAIAEVRRLLTSGVKSIDVGCMQVNLRHHPDAFRSLNDAFEPRHNVAYAARFLKNNFDEMGSWKKAAAAYHSRTPAFGNKYIGLVYNSWRRIINEVRAARAGKVAEVQRASTAEIPINKTTASLDTLTDATQETPRSRKPAHKPVRMKVIELSKKDRRRENGVMVIRPQNAEQSTPAPGMRDVKVMAPMVAEKEVAAVKTPVAEKEAPVAKTVKEIKVVDAEVEKKNTEELKARLARIDAVNAAIAPAQPVKTAKVETPPPAKAQETKEIRMNGEARKMPAGNLESKHEADSSRKSGPRFIFD